jgi:hypothetical protein
VVADHAEGGALIQGVVKDGNVQVRIKAFHFHLYKINVQFFLPKL